MVGREITQMFPKEIVPIGDVALSVRNLTLEGRFRDISFDLRKGEILGFAGLVGSGRSNVAETLFGVTPATSGAIAIDGARDRDHAIPGVAMDAGMAFLTEDRKESGCFLLLDVDGQHADRAAAPRLCARRLRQGARDRGALPAAEGAPAACARPISRSRCSISPAAISRRC